MAVHLSDSEYRKSSKALSKPRGIKQKNKAWSDAQKQEALGAYFLTQNLSEVSRQLTIPRDTLKTWTQKDWWKQAYALLEQEDSLRLTKRLRTLAEKSLGLVEDRIEKGEWHYDATSGVASRREIKALDAHKIANDTLKTVTERENKPLHQEASESTQSALNELKVMFEKFAAKNQKAPVVVTDVISMKDWDE